MIDLKNITFAYPNGKEVLAGLDFFVSKGEVVVLCGESGCGKSTLLRVLNGLIPELYDGNLTAEGTSIGVPLAEKVFPRYVKDIGVVFQNPKTQFFTSDVYSELAFAMENYGTEQQVMEKRIKEVTREFGLEEFLARSMFHLSGGQKQLIAFASACMLKHQLFLLDEPSSNLDGETTERLEEYLLALKREGMTIVISEHRLYYLAEVADRFVQMKDGQVIGSFSRSMMQAKSVQEMHQMGLRELSLTLPQKVEVNQITQEKMQQDDVQIDFEQVAFRYKKAVETLSIDHLSLSSREVTGLVGPNGAGKSTFSKLLAGLLKIKDGQILLNGVSVKGKDLIRESFVVMQDVNLQLFCETVAKELLLKAKGQENFDTICQMLDLKDLLNRHPQTLSGGEKQRVAIASAMLSGKRVIIFDEPTSGLDLLHMKEVSRTIRWLKEQGVLVLIISHDQEFLRCTCERLLYFAGGRVAGDSRIVREEIETETN